MVDVHATLTISELRSVGDIAKRKVVRRLPLKSSYISILAPIQDLDKPWTPLTAVTFTTEPDPDAFGLLSAPTPHERRLVLTLTVSDALSRSQVVQYVTFRAVDVKQGRWGRGLEFIEEHVTVANQVES